MFLYMPIVIVIFLIIPNAYLMLNLCLLLQNIYFHKLGMDYTVSLSHLWSPWSLVHYYLYLLGLAENSDPSIQLVLISSLTVLVVPEDNFSNVMMTFFNKRHTDRHKTHCGNAIGNK